MIINTTKSTMKHENNQKLRSFYVIPPNEWMFNDNLDVIHAKKLASTKNKNTESHIEEFVRQWVLKELIEKYGYPKEWLGDRIIIEESVQIGSTEKQSDISIKNIGHKTYLYVETKHYDCTESEFNKAVGQLQSYLSATHTATIGMVTNGKQTKIFEKKIDPNDYNLIPDIPSYDKSRIRYKNMLTRDFTEKLSDKKTGLKPISIKFENLLFDCHSLIRDIDGLHDDEALDELSKILFVKIFDEREICRMPKGTPFKFQIYGAGNIEEVASNIRELYNGAREYDISSNSKKIIGYERSRGVFKNQIKLSSNAIYKIVEKLQEFSFVDTDDLDLKGRAFQKVLGAAIRSGMGQYFTPHEVVKLIIEIIDPKPSDLILDPFCGSGHFLSHSLQYIENVYGKNLDDYSKYDVRFNRLHGIEKSDRMVRIAMSDMMLRNDGHTNIRNVDAFLTFDNYPDILSLGNENDETAEVFSKVITNPPFGSIMQGEIGDILKRFQLGQKKKSLPLEYIGLERSLQFLRPNGLLAIVLPDGIITNHSAQFVRSWVMSQAKILAIISLPKETFSPFGTMSKTSILIVKKNSKNERISFDYPVFLGNIRNIGYDATGKITKSDDVDKLLSAWNEFKEKSTIHASKNIAYVTTAENIKFRWDFKAGIKNDTEKNYVPISTYIEIIKEKKQLEKYPLELFPYQSIVDMPKNAYLVENVPQIPGNKLYGPKFIAQGGDILFARLGPSMANRKSMLVGKKLNKIYCSNEFLVLRPKKNIQPEDVLYLIKSESFVTQALSKARGSTPSRLRLYDVDLINIQIPKIDKSKKFGIKYIEGRKLAQEFISKAEKIVSDVSPDF